MPVRTPVNKSPGLASSAFARHYLRNLGWFLFLALLRCFSSGGSPHIPIDSVYDVKILLLTDCSIRTSADQYLLAIPRSFSQLTTSFVGSQCQGILPALLLAWPFLAPPKTEFCFFGCRLDFLTETTKFSSWFVPFHGLNYASHRLKFFIEIVVSQLYR